MRYRLDKLAVTSLLCLVLVAPLASQPGPGVDADAYKRISDKLICQCGCHYGLSFCPHLDCPSAPVLRARIREGLAAGQSEPEVLAAMVAEFGPKVLAAPPPEGFNLLGWVMPFAALIAGLWVVRRVVLLWRRRRVAPAAEPPLVVRYREAIEKEWKSLEES
jgi:cytochrome c-type biogenesis protein CcmH/NrfF